jgi:phosphatidylinositol-bisphosphatase
LLFYGRRELLESDHKPVSAFYVLETKRVDAKKLEEVKKQYFYVRFCLLGMNGRF